MKLFSFAVRAPTSFSGFLKKALGQSPSSPEPTSASRGLYRVISRDVMNVRFRECSMQPQKSARILSGSFVPTPVQSKCT